MPWRHQFQMMPCDGFRAGPVVAIERSGRQVVVELRAVGGELRLQAVEHFLGQAARIGRRLHHQRRHGADDRRFCHAAFAMAGNVMHDFAAAGGMADMHGVLEVEMRRQRREVVGVVIHVVAAADLARAAVAAPVMRDDAEAAGSGRTASAHPSHRPKGASHG